MGPVREILAATRKHRTRGMKKRTLRAADTMLPSWLMLVIFIRFAVNCSLALRELKAGPRPVGLLISEFSMVHLLLVVFLFSFLVSSLSMDTMVLDRRRLALSPLGFPTLLLAELAGLLADPLSWVAGAFLVPAMLPLSAFPNPIPALLALVAVLAATILLARSLSLVLSRAWAARRLAGPLKAGFVAVLVVLVLANFDFQWNGSSVSLSVFQQKALLDDGSGAGFISILRPWFPSSWIVRGTPWWSLALLAAALGIFALAFHASIRGRVGRQASAPARRSGRGCPSGGILWVHFSHQIACLLSSTGTRLGALAALGFSAWLIASREPSVNIAILGVMVILVAGFGYPSNLFGRDGLALRRFVLLSPDWGIVFLARDLAYCASAAAPLAALLLATAFRLGAAAAVSLGLTAALIVMLHLLWGNLSSIIIPSSKPDQAAFVNQLFPIAVWGLPLTVHRALAAFGTLAYDAAFAGLLAVSMGLLFTMLRRITSRFADEAESVLERFS